MNYFARKQIKKIIIDNIFALCDWTERDLRYWDGVFEKLKLKKI